MEKLFIMKRELSDIKQMVETYKSELPKLTIFILGPGEHNKDPYAKKCYRKRCQIKDDLALNHNIYFPEEIHKEAKNDGVDVTNTLVFENVLQPLSLAF